MEVDHFSGDKKIGIIVVRNDIETYKEGSQGLLEHALTLGVKFKEPLKVIEKRLNAKNLFLQTYKTIYSKKGIDLIEIEGTLTFEYLDAFSKPRRSEKKYSKYDYRFIKDKYEVDELIVADIKNGLLIDYYGVIVVEKNGYCSISTEIIDLNDNSLFYKNTSEGKIKVEGKWDTPPNYDNLYYPIRKAIENSILIEKMNFNRVKKDITVKTNE